METRSDATYGTWSHPNRPLSVRYSLPAFHEVDFLVGEGYRRIPYGGIEHGGLLFGRALANQVEIESFRQIELDHASGPAFLASEQDLERIKEQMRSAATDPELAGLEPIGLFISHSRRELQIEPAERQVVDSLFTQGPKLLVLFKPEKFKPTRIAFVFPDEEELNIFTLPSPVRPSRARAKRKAAETVADDSSDAQATPSEKPKARRSSRKATLVTFNEALNEQPGPLAVPQPEPLPTPEVTENEPEPVITPVRRIDWRIVIFAAVLSAILLLCCFLYFDWNFLQPPIELHAAAEPGRLTVSWLPDETAGTNEANLHIWSNGGQATVVLSAAERNAGQAKIAAPRNDMTVELVAHHWLHDRRGVVRVLTNK